MISADKALGGSEHFRMFVDELGRAFVRSHLGISRQKLTALLAPKAVVPRAYVFALYWESDYGRSVIDSARHHELCLLRQLVQCHENTIAGLSVRIQLLLDEVRQKGARGGLPHSANERWFCQVPSR
jgi:hypothetical protein